MLPAAALATGGEPLAFMKSGVGVRATGMGTAFTALADDTSACIYNPAGLLDLTDLQLMAETYVMSFGRSVNFIALGKPFKIGSNTYSAGIAWLNYSGGSDIEARATNSDQPDSLIAQYTNLLLFSTATRFTQSFGLGGTFKVVFDGMDEETGAGVGFDIGAKANLFDGVYLGVNIANISTNITWNKSSYLEEVPVAISAGLAYSSESVFGMKNIGLAAAVDATYNSYRAFYPRLGLEVKGNDFFFMRIGYNNGLIWGMGIKLKPSEVFAVRADYAFCNDQILPDVFNHRVGVTLDYIFPHTNGVVDVQKKEEPKKAPAAEKKGDGAANEW